MHKKDVTTKGDGHGIGLHNVSEILNRYDNIYLYGFAIGATAVMLACFLNTTITPFIYLIVLFWVMPSVLQMMGRTQKGMVMVSAFIMCLKY
mgnify:CR=1 FL=1